MQFDFTTLCAYACSAAERAGTLLAEHFNTPMSVASNSTTHDLVTEMDIKSEQIIVGYLRNCTPGCSILGEELGSNHGTSNLTWVIDPLDGTVNYAHGLPIYCVSIAAVIDGVIVAGVIHAPSLGETWSAARGVGAFCNDKRVHVSRVSSLDDAFLVTGFPYNVGNNPGRCHDQFLAMLRRGLPLRRLGSAALDLAWTAGGRFDGFWEVSLKPWDMAAGALLVHEAGGRISHYNNVPFSLENESMVATNGLIHDELVDVLSTASHDSP